MSIKIGRSTFLALALVAVSTAANATTPAYPVVLAPVLNEAEGRYYQVVIHPGVTWDAARAAAEATTLNVAGIDAIQGQLATINSLQEDQFIHNLSLGISPGSASELWVGGFQDPAAVCTPPREPRCGWKWTNDELILPFNPVEPPFTPYTNWLAGEPNDLNGENHLAIGRQLVVGWNDEGHLSLIKGYVIEYGERLAPVLATRCLTGCPLGAWVMTYPQGTIAEGDVDLRIWRVPDDPLRCGVSSLTIKLSDALSQSDGDLVIPANLCAPPVDLGAGRTVPGEIVITRTDGPGVQIVRDVVNIVDQAETYMCDDPITGDPAVQDVVVHRTTLAEDQLESGFVNGVRQTDIGNVVEVTNGCVNPSRGSGKKGSYWIDGLRFHFGTDDPNINLAELIAVQGYKLSVFRAAIKEARSQLKKVDGLALQALGEAAIYLHERGHYDAALFKVRLLLKLNDKLKYTVVAGENPHGELKYRLLNLEDMYSRRIIPFVE